MCWEDYSGDQLQVRRSIWNGRANGPKTKKRAAPVPVIRQLSDRLEMHRQRQTYECTGPLIKNTKGTSFRMNNILNRLVLPALNRCQVCRKAHGECDQATPHEYKRDASLPEWHGWHACRRGLGTRLNQLGVSDVVIQRILRHANVSTTMAYYVKPVASDVVEAMKKLEQSIEALDTNWTPDKMSTRPN